MSRSTGPSYDGSKSPVIKAVTISEEPEHIDSPDLLESGNGDAGLSPYSPKMHRATISGRKLTGRSSINSSLGPSPALLAQNMSSLSLGKPESDEIFADGPAQDSSKLVNEVVAWLQEEKSKRYRRNLKRYHLNGKSTALTDAGSTPNNRSSLNLGDADDHQQDMALDKLESILAKYLQSDKTGSKGLRHRSSASLARKNSIGKMMKRRAAQASSDTDWQDGDLLVPNVEAMLDNSKTMSYAGGATSSDNLLVQRKDKEHWIKFKRDIVRMTHTLKLKGWRSVAIENGEDIMVERLSGALTNAVYVVSPPKVMPAPPTGEGTPRTLVSRKPKKLLLRVYGPQVEHLIDREAELQILRRLARKSIGPRMLGTFTNGRFEEFFHARTLGPQDLRVPDTSKQIAKRMRELHDGIELLEQERKSGPFVFINWDKWVDRCERVVSWLDEQVRRSKQSETKETIKYANHGLICGVEWPIFRQIVEQYRKLIYDRYGGRSAISKHLVFAHNDTQYGNLMRLTPTGESPLLMPMNEHKQLVVIDFEYASANTRGLEFANHFTEWCYNYHHPEKSFACNTNFYPTYDEQYRFIRAYVMHRPQFNPAASATPKMEGREKTNISDFMLDARTPQGDAYIDYEKEEKERLKAQDREINELMEETRIWRIANSAQWVAWGIMQAKIPELDENTTTKDKGEAMRNVHPQSDLIDDEVKALQEDAKDDRPESRVNEETHEEGDGEAQPEFDYLAYARDRAMFFWGDVLQLGLVKEADLPDTMRGEVKFVKH